MPFFPNSPRSSKNLEKNENRNSLRKDDMKRGFSSKELRRKKSDQKMMVRSLSGRALVDFKTRQEQELNQIVSLFKNQADPNLLEQCKQLFLTYDVDGSGDIDILELHTMMQKLGQPKTHLELKMMIRDVDSTGKGRNTSNHFK